jgi:DNA-binding transcriptional LysR family regulator
MDTDQLVAFERVVREGSFSRAAWALGLAQPTISARMQALEQALGGPLFIRGGRGVSLTDLGASFLPYARRAIEVLEAGVEAAREAQAGMRGRVSIGVLESLSGSFLGPALAQFHAEHPQVDVLVRAGRHEQLIELLRDGVVGMALIAWPCADALTTELELLLGMSEPMTLVVAPQHRLASGGPYDEDELLAAAQPFLIMRWWLSLPPTLARLAQRAQPAIDVPMDTGRQMVLSGVGACFCPWMQVADYLEQGRLKTVALRGIAPMVRTSALVRRASGPPLSASARALTEAIIARAARLGLVALLCHLL